MGRGLLAFYLHRSGAAHAQVVTFTADGTPWIWARLDWVVARVGLDPARMVEVLDWCHAVHHLSLALQASGLSEEERAREYARLRPLLKAGRSRDVIKELDAWAAGRPGDAAVWHVAEPSPRSLTVAARSMGPIQPSAGRGRKTHARPDDGLGRWASYEL
jgi:hypothetical protein